jgi:predicted ATPase
MTFVVGRERHRQVHDRGGDRGGRGFQRRGRQPIIPLRERLDAGGPGLLAAYGGRSPHERAHGESFLDLVVHRFEPNGLYVLDEPEAVLSVRGCMALMARMHDLSPSRFLRHLLA